MKKIFSIILCFLTIFFCAGCGREVDDYSVKEHTQRIRQRIEKNGWGNMELEKDDFEVYPLYGKNDKLNYFLVEFEVGGFGFVGLVDQDLVMSCVSGKNDMYRRGKFYNQWSPYEVDETNSQPYPDEDKIWILDENGERIYYKQSPYSVTGNINEKKYLLQPRKGDSILAVKKDGEFINLIDGKTVDFSTDDYLKGQATLSVGFNMKVQFYL